MEIPPGFGPTCGSNKVCRLRKALYGLKQSPRAWFGRFTKAMVCLGYKQSQGDHTLFFKHSRGGKLTVLLVYVDDLLQETGKLGCKPASVPIEQNHRISFEEESDKVDKGQYQILVGKLIY